MRTEKIIEITSPCDEGEKYLRKYKTLRGAWKHCKRGDWMLWLAERLNVNIRLLTLAKGYCANTVRHLMKDERSIAAVDAAIAFGRGEITREELDKAAVAAALAAADAANAAYIAAADAAVYTADAAHAAADAAHAAADAHADAADAAADAADAAAAARKKNQKETADICRKYITDAVMEAALEAAEKEEK